MMAAQESQGLLLKILGNDFVKAHEANKNVKPTSGGGNLPGGIQAGVAQLKDCRILQIKQGKKNAGKLMFYADGIVQLPLSHDGITCKGKITRISEVIFDTPTRTRKTVGEHIKWIYEQLIKLGVKVSEMTPAKIELAMEALRRQKPYFEFRTWLPPKSTTGPYAGRETQVMHLWEGKVEYKPEKPQAQDNTEQVDPSTHGDVDTDQLQGDITEDHSVNNGVMQEATPTIEDVDPSLVDGGDIYSVAKRADEDNSTTDCQQLLDWAKERGIPDEITKNTNSWRELADLISTGYNPPTEGETKKEEAITFAVGDNWNYRPLNPVTKAKSEKPVVVRIESVDESKGTVNCCQLENPKFKYKNVATKELEPLT